LRAEADKAIQAMDEFCALAASFAQPPLDVLLEFQNLLADGSKAFAIHSEFRPTAGAGEVAVVFEPSQRFLDLLAALRAGDRDQPVIDVGTH